MRTIRSNALLRKGILNAGRRAQRLGAIHTFPRQIDVRSAEMAERGRLTINRATQIQHVDDAGRTKIKLLSDDFRQCVVGNDAGALRIDQQRNRIGHADCVSQLDFTALGQSRRNDVLRDVARGIRGAAINFCRILAAERAAAVAGISAVCIDDDFTAGQVFSSISSAGMDLQITLSMMAAESSSWLISGACWVETTTVSTRTGLSPSYSIVT